MTPAAIAPELLGWAGVSGKPGETGRHWLGRIDAARRREDAATRREWERLTARQKDQAMRDRGLRL